LRRFLRRSLGLLEALEVAFRHEAELPGRYEAALREAGGLSGARFAAVARRRPGLRVKYEVLPAVALKEGTAVRFAGLSRGQLVDISDLIKTELSPPREGGEPAQNTGFRTIHVPAQAPSTGGVELVAPTAAAAAGAAAMLPPEAGAVPPGPGQEAAVVSGKQSVLADAACPSADCGPADCSAIGSGIDCSAFDWGSIDCGGAPDCST
jgi:hypothetical protein